MDDSKLKNQNEDIDMEDIEEAPQFGNERVSDLQAKQDLLTRDNTMINRDEPLDPQFDNIDEEFAQDIALDASSLRHEPIESDERETDMQDNVQTGWGWTAVVLSVLSFFMMPVILGAAGVIIGFVAKRRGADTLGNTAIIAGAVAIILQLFIAPFV